MIPRFYCPVTDVALAAGRLVALPHAAAHHALKVLRLRPGDELVLFDGTGGEYPGRVADAGRKLSVMLDAWCDVECEAPLRITLAQALPSGDKMDLVVQKAVELGVASIQPLEAKRSVVRLSGERAEKRIAHWRQVAVSACEQSGRNRVPEVHGLLDLAHYLAVSPPAPVDEGAPLRLLLSPHQGVSLAELSRPTGAVTLLVGPEGGFEAAEEAMARSVGFQPVRLGPRVLRTETAGLATLAAIMALWGDF